MRRIALFALVALASAAVCGESPLDCIDPDVARALLQQGSPVITANMPAELEALKMPRDFTWIGSTERITGRLDASSNATQVTAAWRSGLAPTAARAAVISALAISGWEVREQPGMNINVFDSGMRQVSVPACREGKPVNVSANALDGVTYVLATLQRGDNNLNTICNQPVRPASITGYDQYLPHLQMPVDPATGRVVRPRDESWGYGGTAFNARTQFDSKDSAGNLARQLTQQMVGQGWSSDASWSGAATAGSSWSKRIDSGLLQGTLSVTNIEGQQFLALLRVTRLQ